eukprot:684121-Rhodomonas_salina.2
MVTLADPVEGKFALKALDNSMLYVMVSVVLLVLEPTVNDNRIVEPRPPVKRQATAVSAAHNVLSHAEAPARPRFDLSLRPNPKPCNVRECDPVDATLLIKKLLISLTSVENISVNVATWPPWPTVKANLPVARMDPLVRQTIPESESQLLASAEVPVNLPRTVQWVAKRSPNKLMLIEPVDGKLPADSLNPDVRLFQREGLYEIDS